MTIGRLSGREVAGVGDHPVTSAGRRNGAGDARGAVRPGFGVVTFAASLNAAGRAAAPGRGRSVTEMLCAPGTDVSTRRWERRSETVSGIRPPLDEQRDVLLN
ncbi:hypothetical protein GCM10010247_58110 [Streptomyces calvus]|nr:hypothetical protein GCM10010247_58110 [Streptomyces calvus]